MELNSLRDLMVDKLNDIYNAEKKTELVLPKIVDACKSEELKSAFKEHIEQSKDQVKRLEQVFETLKIKPQSKDNPVVNALINKCNEVLSSQGNPDVKDAALIAVEQAIEHYEIAAYGTVRSFALTLGMEDVASIFEETLKEESYTDEKLSKIADQGYSGQQGINKKAA